MILLVLMNVLLRFSARTAHLFTTIRGEEISPGLLVLRNSILGMTFTSLNPGYLLPLSAAAIHTYLIPTPYQISHSGENLPRFSLQLFSPEDSQGPENGGSEHDVVSA